MIGRPEWFQARKYGGWGLSPKTWQGWAYIGVMIALIIGVNALPFIPGDTKLAFMYIFSGVMVLDVIDIMFRLKKDEREKMHEAIAERNAAWFMVAALGFGIAYQAAVSAVKGTVEIDPVILITLFGGMIVKMGTNIYLDRKD